MTIGLLSGFFFAIFTMLMAAVPTLASDSDMSLETVKDIPLPGRATRMDYADLDTRTKRLYVSHLGDNLVLVFDIVRQRPIKEIRGVPGVHGVIVDAASGTVFATATKKDTLVEIDGKTLRIVARVPAGHHPDGLAYDPVEGRVFVSDETGKTVDVIDVPTVRRMSEIPVGGEVGNTRYDPVSGLVFSAVQSKDEIAVIDPRADRVLRRVPVENGCYPHGLVIEPGGRFAFVACQKKSVLIGLDLENGRERIRSGVGSDPDVLALDPVRFRLYVASESGVVSVFVRGRSGWRKAWSGFVARRAHTVAVDPATGRIYLPLQDVGNRPVLRVMELRTRTEH